MKKTALYDFHLKNNAKMITFADYLLPLSFTNSKDEHLLCRHSLGIFDVSHMAKFVLSGKNATSVLEYVLTANISKMLDFEAKYSLILNFKGFILDDVYIYKKNYEEFIIIANCINRQKIYAHFENYKKDCILTDISDFNSILSVQGPNSARVLKLLFEDRVELEKNKILEIDGILISGNGYTGETGFELLVLNSYIESVYSKLIKILKDNKIEYANCGLASRDSLRFEASYSLYGQEIDENTSPKESLLMWICKKNEDFLGKENLLKYKKKKILKTIKMLDNAYPRHNYKVYNMEKVPIGYVATGLYSPSRDGFFANIFVDPAFKDEELFVEIRANLKKAKIIKRPIVSSI